MRGSNRRAPRISCRDFPGGPVVTNLPSSAGDVGLIHGQGTKIPRASGQPSLSITIPEPILSGACAPELGSSHS